jgi:peptide/nickel transport system permease protein
VKIKNDISFILSKWVIGMYFMIAIFGSFLAGDVPIFCKKNDGISFPLISSIFTKSSFNTKYPEESCIMPFIPYSPLNIDKDQPAALSPFDDLKKGTTKSKHWLGTDKLGRDVASGMIHGTATALKIGIISVFFAFIVGVSLGMMSAYYKDDGIQISAPLLMATLLIIPAVIYYMIMEWVIFNPSVLSLISACLAGIIIFGAGISWSNKSDYFKKYNVPIDLLLLKVIEIRKSFPGIFILLALVSLFAIPSIWNIVFIIALLGWTEFARFARAETLAVKEENYILSVKVLGFSDIKIIFRHILPNILPTLMVMVCFSIGSAVLLESTLSFLGIGLPVEEVTWGKMMAEGRNMNAWWLVVFPGLAIFILILSLNTLATGYQKSNFKRLF